MSAIMEAVNGHLEQVSQLVATLKERQAAIEASLGPDVVPDAKPETNCDVKRKRRRAGPRPRQAAHAGARVGSMQGLRDKAEKQGQTNISITAHSSPAECEGIHCGEGPESAEPGDMDVVLRARAIIRAAGLAAGQDASQPEPESTRDGVASGASLRIETHRSTTSEQVDSDDPASPDSLQSLSPRSALPPGASASDDCRDRLQVWIPLIVKGMATTGSGTVFFDQDCRERAAGLPKPGDTIRIDEAEFSVVRVDSSGLSVMLDPEVGTINKARLAADQLVTLLVRVPVDEATPAELRRARMRGCARPFRVSPLPLGDSERQAEQRRRASARQRQAIERARMEAQDELSRLVSGDEARKLQLQAKALALQEKTRQRLRERALEKKRAARAKLEQQVLLEQEETDRAREAELRAKRAAAESQQRVLEARRAKHESAVSKPACQGQPETEADPRAEFSAKESQLQKRSKQRVQQKLREQRLQEELRRREEERAAQQPRRPAPSNQDEGASGKTELELRQEAKQRLLRFERRAAEVREQEEARYAAKSTAAQRKSSVRQGPPRRGPPRPRDNHSDLDNPRDVDCHAVSREPERQLFSVIDGSEQPLGATAWGAQQAPDGRFAEVSLPTPDPAGSSQHVDLGGEAISSLAATVASAEGRASAPLGSARSRRAEPFKVTRSYLF